MDCSVIYRILFVINIFFTSCVNAIEFEGKFLQGHFILGKTSPQAVILIDKKKVKVSDEGYFVFGVEFNKCVNF